MSMTKIATVTVGSGGASSIDFTSIPGTMTDLMIHVSGRSDQSAAGTYPWAEVQLQPNGSSSGLTARNLYGFGGSPYSNTSNSATGGMSTGNLGTANTFGSTTIYIPNYAGSTNKSWSLDTVTENNSSMNINWLSAVLWSNTAAITSIKLSAQVGSFVQYSTATLYGITKGSLAGVTVS